MYALPLHDALPISSWNGQLHSFTTTVPDSSEYSISDIKHSSESRSARLCSCSSLSSSTSPNFRSAFESRSSQKVWKNSSIVDSSPLYLRQEIKLLSRNGSRLGSIRWPLL